MIRLAFIVLLTCNLLFAYTYDKQLTQIHTKIAPRIALMSHYKGHEAQGDLHIYLLFEEGDDAIASRLEDGFYRNYPKGLLNRKLAIHTQTFSSFRGAPRGALVFLCESDRDVVAEIVKKSREEGFVTMSFRDALLEYGVMVSLHIGKSLKPIINLESAKQSNIHFDQTLMSISKIYRIGESQ